MNGLQNITGAPASIEIDGRNYQLSPLTLRALGEVERRVIVRRISPLDALADCIDRFSPAQQRLLIDRAVEETSRLSLAATQEEVAAFLASYEGICFFFYLAACDQHPEIDSPETAQRLLDRLDPLDILRVGRTLAAVAGLDALEAAAKKSHPPTATRITGDAAAEQPIEATAGDRKDESLGRPSSSDSPVDTDGRPRQSAD